MKKFASFVLSLWSKRSAAIGSTLLVLAVLVACGDDDSVSVTRPRGDSSSACEDCDGSSSSFSVTPQSSESEISVSSSSVPEGYVDPSTVVKGVMTDERDGKTYKTVTIGTQTWMAENLNYAYTEDPYTFDYFMSDSTSWCYDNDVANCAKYGRLYTWATAMDSVGRWSANGKGCGYCDEDDCGYYRKTCSPTYPVRGICPEGWHLPDTTEWKILLTAVGGRLTAGKMLKSASGWNDYKGVNGNGTDAYAFSAMPASYRDYNGSFGDNGNDTYFWSSIERECCGADYITLHYSNDGTRQEYDYKGYGHSVRCVKDE